MDRDPTLKQDGGTPSAEAGGSAFDSMDFPPRIFTAPTKRYRDGEPCHHLGCLSHVSHPCEGCGRVAGKTPNDRVERLPTREGGSK